MERRLHPLVHDRRRNRPWHPGRRSGRVLLRAAVERDHGPGAAGAQRHLLAGARVRLRAECSASASLLQYGPLKAGFSVTASGIIEGVLATFNPYQPGDGQRPSRAGSGRLLLLAARTRSASRALVRQRRLRGGQGQRQRLVLGAAAADLRVLRVDVDHGPLVRRRVRLDQHRSRLFSIRLSFSFSMRIKETFTIDNGGTPPWIAAGPAADAHALSGPADRRLGYRRTLTPAEIAAAADDGPLVPVAADHRTEPHAQGVARARPDRRPRRVRHQRLLPRASTLLCLADADRVRPGDRGTLDEVLARNAAASTDTSFELLAQMVLRWAIAAVQGSDVTPEDLNDARGHRGPADVPARHRAGQPRADQIPIGPSDVDTFMTRQFEARPAETGRQRECHRVSDAAGLRVSSKGYGASSPRSTTPSRTTTHSTTRPCQYLRDYFDQLAVDVRRAAERRRRTAAGAGRAVDGGVGAVRLLPAAGPSDDAGGARLAARLQIRDQRFVRRRRTWPTTSTSRDS